MSRENVDESSSFRFIWVLYIFLFLIYLCYSYSFFFSSTFSSLNSRISVIPAILIALLILRFIGETSKAIYAARAGERRGWFLVPVTLLPALLLTVLALLPTSVWAFLGPDTVSADLRYVTEQVGTMKAGADSWLKVPEYETMKSEVEKLKQSLYEEIHSVGTNNTCGVGDAASRTIAAIHTYIPEIYVYPGTNAVHNCSNQAEINRISERYMEQIDNFLQKSDMSIRFEIEKRKVFIAKFIPAATSELQSLQALADELARISSFLPDPGEYDRALRQLEASQRFYSESYAQMIAFEPNSVPRELPRTLDISHSQSIGRSTQIVDTYAFLPMGSKKILVLLLSFSLDLIAVYLTWMRLQKLGGPRRRKGPNGRDKTLGGILVLN